MEALKLCSGRLDTSLPLIPRELRELLPKLEKVGIIRPAAEGETLRPEQEYRKYPARYIRSAHWSVTGRCNYRCKHRYMSAPDAKYGELSHEQIMKMVQELSDCGVMNVSLTGGEPLVRSDFLEIVDALTQRGIRITQSYSNGALVQEPLLKALDQRGIHPEFNMRTVASASPEAPATASISIRPRRLLRLCEFMCLIWSKDPVKCSHRRNVWIF